MNNVYRVPNFLSPDELEIVKELMDERTGSKNDETLGRVLYGIYLEEEIISKIQKRVEALTGLKLGQSRCCSCTDYSSEYGQPNLPPHYDGDDNILIIDYQFDSNTSWGLGVDTEVFHMEDNEAVIFNPNEHVHWRPHKTFKEGEYVRMVFFRFTDPDQLADYSHLNLNQSHELFDDARKAREIAKSEGIE
jgi:hypothetical protein